MIVSLREDGHDILYITESKPGILDEEMLKKAFDKSRILLTEDKGFGELVGQIRSKDNKRFIKHIGELNRKHKIALLENLKILILDNRNII